MDIEPLAVNIPEILLEDMHRRLRTTRWADDYDWRAQDAAINQRQMNGSEEHWTHLITS